MQSFTFVLLSAILVQNITPLFGTEEDVKTSSVSQLDDTLKWLTDSMANDIINSVLKVFQPVEDVHFYLYTKENSIFGKEVFSNDKKSLEASGFNRDNPTRILIHGWMSSPDREVNTLIRDAYFITGPHNIIVISWISKSLGLYSLAAASVPEISKKVATFIDFMAKHDFSKPENLTIVGHSMGAHIAGMAGRSLKSGQIYTIVGLDPALPLFPYSSTENRLCPSDAYYVESIHTDGSRTGHVEPIGKAAFYPNGGQIQLGCGSDPSGSCAHARSYKFFAEAIKMNGFPSIECPDYLKAVAMTCGSKFSDSVRMGAPSNAELAEGVYYVPTKAKAPYAF